MNGVVIAPEAPSQRAGQRQMDQELLARPSNGRKPLVGKRRLTDGDGIVDASEACPADLELDLQLSKTDILQMLSQWGPCPPLCLGDIDGDGEVGIMDLLLLLALWGPCP